MLKNKQYILFFVSVISIALAVYVYNLKSSLVSESRLKENYFSEIQENLEFHASRMFLEVEKGISYLEKGNIDEFESDYAVFYVKNGFLNHWTDYHIPYNVKFSSGSATPWKVVKTSQGVFLVYNQNRVSETGVRQIIAVVELYRDYKLSSSFLKSGFNNEIFGDFKVLRKAINQKEGVLLTVDNSPLWRIDLDIEQERQVWVVLVWLILLAIGVIGLCWFIVLNVRRFYLGNKPITGLLLLVSFLFLLRFVMLYSDFPLYYFDFSLFDPGVFGSTTFNIPQTLLWGAFDLERSFSISLNPSFGDLLINIGCLIIICLYCYFMSVKYEYYHKITQLTVTKKHILSFCLLWGSFLTIWLLNLTFLSVFENSVVNFDITKSLHIDEPEMIYILIFTLTVFLFVIINHFVLKSLISLYQDGIKSLLIKGLLVSVIFVCFSFLDQDVHFLIIVLNFFYLSICLIFELFSQVKKIQYKTYIYLTFASLVCSILVSLVLSNVSLKKDIRDRRALAGQLLLHNDFRIGYLITQVGNQVVSDPNISRNLRNGFVSKEVIESTVRKKYFNTDFDEYDVKFSYFNLKGNGYYNNELRGSFNDWVGLLNKPKYMTEESGVYYVNDPKKEFYGTYYQFLTVKNAVGDKSGYIVISYTLKKYIAKSILPGLFQLSSKSGIKNLEHVNYAIFESGNLQYSVGDFNYSSNYFKPFLEDKNVFNSNFLFDGYYHWEEKGVDQKLVVISSKDTSTRRIVTNFSFHFLILITFGLITLILKVVISFKTDTTSDFSTKIQTYLNIATFAPMLILSVFILGLISSSFKADQEVSYENSTEILSSHVFDYLKGYTKGEIDKYTLKKSIGKLSKYSGSDINLYNADGVLMLSSQPLLYEAGVVSNLINPEARSKLFGMKKRTLSVEENIGDFIHRTVYVALYDSENASFLGVMSVPFFNSSYQIEQKRISALTIIINVFAIAYIFLLIASFFVTKGLTSPLKLIANKLRKVETGHENEPLYWGANDELGLLVDGYNQMLIKIEESKKTIVKTEKEQAWKDMAQQVAHEIKNPLTPMKLKLQHLKRIISTDDERTGGAIDSLLEQVETMNEIATSFSSFAKMPTPDVHRINLTEVVESVSILYQNNEDYDVVLDVLENIFVNGDHKLLGRIVTNLILNGVQSVPSDQRPLINILLKQDMEDSNKVILSISDNGSGIPPEIHDKVFIPNFTTKYTGSGIGLAVAKNGIKQMGGDIWFDTHPDTGTTFFISLNKL